MQLTVSTVPVLVQVLYVAADATVAPQPVPEYIAGTGIGAYIIALIRPMRVAEQLRPKAVTATRAKASTAIAAACIFRKNGRGHS